MSPFFHFASSSSSLRVCRLRSSPSLFLFLCLFPRSETTSRFLRAALQTHLSPSLLILPRACRLVLPRETSINERKERRSVRTNSLTWENVRARVVSCDRYFVTSRRTARVARALFAVEREKDCCVSTSVAFSDFIKLRQVNIGAKRTGERRSHTSNGDSSGLLFDLELDSVRISLFHYVHAYTQTARESSLIWIREYI